MMKRIISICMLLICSVTLFTGCGADSKNSSATADSSEPTKAAQTAAQETQSDQTDGKKIKVGFAVLDLSSTFFVQCSNGFKEEAEKLGMEVTVVDCKSDASKQVSAIENFIVQKLDVIVCSPIDSNAVEPLVAKAQEAGIKFISSSQEVQGYDAFITVPEYEYGWAGGTMAGEWMGKNLTGQIEVAIIDYPQMEQLIDRAKGLEEGILKNYPEATIYHQAAPSIDGAMKAAETIMQAHPDIKVISCINDDFAMAAAEAVKSMNKDTDDFAVFGLDASEDALKKMNEGGILRGTIDVNPIGIGTIIADTALQLANGETLDEKIIKVPMTQVTQ